MLKVVGALAFVSCVSAFGAASGDYPLIEKDVQYTLGDLKLNGYLMYQDMPDNSPRPGFLALPYFMGAPALPNRDIARTYAERGMVVFIADYYGKNLSDTDPEVVASTLTQDYFGMMGDRPQMRKIGMAGYEQLASLDMVDPDKIAVVGFCAGGTVAAELARAGAKAAVMISMHGEIGSADEDWDPEAMQVDYFAGFFGRKDPLIPTDKIEAGMTWLDNAGTEYSMTTYGKEVHAFSHIMSDAVYKALENLGFGGAAKYSPDTAALAWAATDALLKQYGLL